MGVIYCFLAHALFDYLECFKDLAHFYSLTAVQVFLQRVYAGQKDCIALFEDVIVYIHHKVHLPLKLVCCVYLKFVDWKV